VGVRPAVVWLARLGLLAAALAVAVQGLGSLLVLAVLIAPAVAVRPLGLPPARAMRWASAVAIVGGIAGIYASDAFGTAAGASVALALCLAAVAGSLAQAGRGVGRLRSRASQ
jgi:ABC-type Mn2+/Zn2+ transport system permease subunit